MNEFFIVMSGGLYGHYGKGSTRNDAIKAWKKAGGRKSEKGYREVKFVSELPFAPFDRAAKDSEADAWVGRDGSINWIRCEKID